MKIRSAKVGASAAMTLAAMAWAQPTPDVTISMTNPQLDTGTLTGLAAAGTKWIKLTIPQVSGADSPSTYLDIDTNGGTLTGGDSMICLFNSVGAVVASNDDSGPGLYSMLSFGATTPTRPGLAPTGNAGSTGSTHAGGVSLAAGDYYLAVTGFSATFSAPWTVTTTHTRTGDVAYVINLNNNSAPTPPSGSGSTTNTGTIGNCNGEPFRMTVTVTPGTNPASTGITVTGNLSSIGGSASQAFFNDGTNGDLTANDNIWSFASNHPGSGGTNALTWVVADAQARSTSGTLNLVTSSCQSGTPGTFVNMGTLNPAAEQTRTDSATYAAGDIKWFKMNLASDVTTSCAFLDIWTEFVTGSLFDDTEIGLYDSVGALVDNDDDDGGGPIGFLSELSWGATTPTRATGGAGYVGGNGRDGTLAAGTYWLAMAGFNTIFGATNWTIQTDSADTGDVTLKTHVGGGGAGGSIAVTSGTQASGPCALVCITATATADTTCGPVGVVTVVADTTSLGGGPGTPMVDDGTGCDASAGDGIYSAEVLVGALADGSYSVPISATGSLGGSGGAIASIGVDNAGDSLATANKRGDGVSTTLAGAIGTPTDVDIHAICVFDTSAAFVASVVGGASFDTQLFLFDGTGTGVLMDDDEPVGTTLQSEISGVAFTLPGTVAYLAISRFDNDPLNAGGAEIWADTPFDVVRAPDGTAAAGDFVLASWNNTPTAAAGAYTITLTGASQLCPADYDDGSATGSPDCGVDISDLLYYLFLFDLGSTDADLDDGSGTGTRDCGVDISDLLYYLFRFDLGC